MLQYGFKRITLENFMDFDTRGANIHITKEIAIQAVKPYFEPQLSNKVPEETAKLFEVARGTMVLAVYFYPLYIVGTEHLCKAAENSLRKKCESLGIVPNYKNYVFGNMLGALINNKVIHRKKDIDLWNCLRELRNIFSHPEIQSIYTPEMALQYLKLVAKTINYLFEAP